MTILPLTSSLSPFFLRINVVLSDTEAGAVVRKGTLIVTTRIKAALVRNLIIAGPRGRSAEYLAGWCPPYYTPPRRTAPERARQPRRALRQLDAGASGNGEI